MGGSAPKQTSSTNITKVEPPEYIQPYSVNLATRADALSNRAYTPYQGTQVSPLNQSHNRAMDMVTARAIRGSPTFDVAENQTQKTLQGQYLGKGAARNSMAGVNNPYLNNVINQSNNDISRAFTNSTMPQTDASFARSGAFGGSAWQQANAENNRQLASELAKNTSNLRYGDYQTQQQLAENLANRQTQAYGQERGNMMGAVGMGQNLANQKYTDAQNLLGVGDIKRDYSQTLANQQYQNFLNQQNFPLQNLDILANAIRTSMGNGGTTTQSAQLPSINPTASMIGGGLTGATLGNALGGGTGAAIGGGLGALSGLF